MKINQLRLFGLICIGLLMVSNASGRDHFLLQKIKARIQSQSASQDTVIRDSRHPDPQEIKTHKNIKSKREIKTIPGHLRQAEKGSITGYVYEKSYSGVECETDNWYWGSDPQLTVPKLGGCVGDTLLVPVRVTQLNTPVNSLELTLSLGSALVFDTVDISQSMIGDAGWSIDANVTDQQVRIAAEGAEAISIVSEYDYDSTQDTLFSVKIIISETPFQFVPIELSDVIFDTGVQDVELVHGGIYVSPDSVVMIPPQHYVTVDAYNEYGRYVGYGDPSDSDDGAYTIDHLPPGSYYLLADSYEYGDMYYSQASHWQDALLVQVASNQTTSGINFILEDQESAAGTGVIAGTVKKSSGAPVTDCRVYVYYGENDFDFAGAGTVDSQGVYVIEGLQSGEYRVRVRYDGLENLLDSWYLDRASYEEATPVQVTEPDTTRDIDIVLKPGCILSGQVLDAQGHPAGEGFEVDACVGEYDYVKYTETDSDGSFELIGLPPGTYKIRVEDPFYRGYPDIWYGDAGCYQDADDVVAELNHPVENIIVRFREGGSICGTVYRPDGTPVETVNGMLEIYDIDESFVDCLQTDDDGVYEIMGLAAGRYKVYYECWSYYENITGAWHQNAGDFDTARWIEVKSGEATTGIDVHLCWGGAVRGRVFCPPDCDLSDGSCEVIAYNQNERPMGSVRLFDSYYEITGLRPGEYKMMFSYHGDENLCDVWYPDACGFEYGEFVTVKAKEYTGSVNFTLEHACRIQGYVKDMQGQPLCFDEHPMLNITVIDASTGHFVDDSEASFNGGYDFLLPSGEYKLYCCSHYFNLYESDQDSLSFSFYSDGVSLSDSNTRVIAAEPNDILKLDDWVIQCVGGGISGTLFDQKTGLPINDSFYAVAAVNEDSMAVKLSAYIALTGQYALYGLRPGKYCLVALKGTDFWGDEITAQWHEAIRASYEDMDSEFYVPVPEGVTWISVGDTLEKAVDIYFLEAVPVGIHEESVTCPESFRLEQNYPNPFNPVTNIQYTLPTAVHVEVLIFNALGQQVVSLTDEKQTAGVHWVQWDGSGFSSGMYFYRIQAGEFCDTKKCLLLK
ncbi:carboxypeptidase regulatory-like domain-containing protein [bacterium]|nr:carboxypeptidase regulatory-like domain-containing protein [bacterium]